MRMCNSSGNKQKNERSLLLISNYLYCLRNMMLGNVVLRNLLQLLYYQRSIRHLKLLSQCTNINERRCAPKYGTPKHAAQNTLRICSNIAELWATLKRCMASLFTVPVATPANLLTVRYCRFSRAPSREATVHKVLYS